MKNALFLASGRGSNFQSFVDHVRLGVLKEVAIKALVCNHSGAKVLERARAANILTYEIEGITGRKFASTQERNQARSAFDQECLSITNNLGVDFIILTGFDQILSKSFTDNFPFRILNIHPAYDMKQFGGKNMVGVKVHEAVIAQRAAYSGCTIHFVTSDVDQGPALLKRRVDVKPNDSPDVLASRILEQEHLAYPEALQLLVDGRVIVSDSGRQCYLDRYSDNWDIAWLMRQQAYVDYMKSQTINEVISMGLREVPV